MSDTNTASAPAGDSTGVADTLDFNLDSDDATGVSVEQMHELPPSAPKSAEGEAAPGTERARAADGKFAKKDAEPAVAAEGAETAQQEPPPAVPFQYRAMGQTHGLDGAVMDAAGNVTIPAEKVGLLRAALNDHHLATGEFRPVMERQSAQIREYEAKLKDYQQRETMGDPIVSYFDQLMSAPDEASFIENVFAMRQNWSALKAQAEVAYWKQKAAGGANAAEPATAARADAAPANSALPSPEQAWHSTNDALESLRIEQYRDVSAGDWQQITAAIKRTPFAFIRPATAQDAQQHPDVQVGESVFDHDLAAADVADRIAILKKVREDSQKAAKLAAENARKTQTSIATPPGTGGASGAKPAAKARSFATVQDVDDYLNSDEL